MQIAWAIRREEEKMATQSDNRTFGVVPLLIVLLALFAAAVHLYLGVIYPDTLFVLNGLGYLGLR
jgi:hypothetical protein